MQRAKLTVANSAWMGDLELNPNIPTVKIQFELVGIKKPKLAKFEFADLEASVNIEMELELA